MLGSKGLEEAGQRLKPVDGVRVCVLAWGDNLGWNAPLNQHPGQPRGEALWSGT